MILNLKKQANRVNGLGSEVDTRPSQIMKCAVLLLICLLGCRKQEVPTTEQPKSDKRLLAAMSDKAQIPSIYKVLRDIPWETMLPDIDFAKVRKIKPDSYSFVLNDISWKFPYPETIEKADSDGTHTDITIQSNVDASSFLESYIGCNLYFHGVVALNHFYNKEAVSYFRLVLLLRNHGTDEHIVETETLIYMDDSTNSVQVSANFRFPKETSLSKFQEVLHKQCKQYLGICKQVERLKADSHERGL